MWQKRQRYHGNGRLSRFLRAGQAVFSRSFREVILLVCCSSVCAQETAIFFWNRGGAGHYSVKEARKSEWLSSHKGHIYDVDLFGDGFINDIWLPGCGKLGDFSMSLWNKAQRDGNIERQKLFLDIMKVAEVVFHPVVYYKAKKLFLSLDEEPSAVISTQALCIAAVTAAMREVNKQRGWNMKLDLQMIEMPTEQPTYIFKSLASIKNKRRFAKLITLKTFKPFIKSGISEEAFWEKYCGKIEVVISDKLPVRESFLNQASLLGQATVLPFTTGNIPIEASDQVLTLLLGSQPSTDSVLSYLNTVIGLAKKNRVMPHTTHFFIYTGHAGNALEEKIVKRLAKGDIPSWLHIVPFTTQGEKLIAHLLARSDVTLTRSGAAMTMELLHLNAQEMRTTLIHAEGYGRKQGVRRRKRTMGKEAAIRSLLLEKGINSWESGNAEYLECEIGAQITHPKYIRSLLQELSTTRP